MRIPAAVKIGSFTYDVRRPRMIDRFSPEVDGRCDHHALVIEIEDEIPVVRAEEILLHEMLHAIDVLMCVGLSEDQVTRLSYGLHMALKDNGLLAESDDNP